MKYFYSLLIFSFLISCNLGQRDEEEEFDYYESIIGEEFQTVADQTRMAEYDYSNDKDLIVETEDSNGIKYSMVIPASAAGLTFSESFSGQIAPITAIQNLPEGVDFQFGLDIEPYGMRFVKPVKITIELPGNFDTQNLRGFYHDGAGGYAYLEPLKIKRSSGSTQAIFEVLHFSSYGGISVADNNFDCPDPRSAQSCEDLREIVACAVGIHEVGINEELNPQDQAKANKVLKTWMEYQLKYADGSSSDYSDLFEFEYEISQYLCWKTMTQYYNSDSEAEAVFGSLYREAQEYIIKEIADIMQEANELCIADLSDDECLDGSSRDLTRSYFQWLAIAQQLGIDDDPRIIGDIFEFCNNSITNLLEHFIIVQSGTHIEIPGDDNDNYKSYSIVLESTSQIVQVDYFMSNLLGELIEINDSTIKWVEITNPATGNVMGFYYNNGTIGMSSTLRAAISECNHPGCPTYYFGGFEVFKDDCYMATVRVVYNRK